MTDQLPIVDRGDVEQHLENIKAWKAALNLHLDEAEKLMVAYTVHIQEAATIAMRLKAAGCKLHSIDVSVGFKLRPYPPRNGRSRPRQSEPPDSRPRARASRSRRTADRSSSPP